MTDTTSDADQHPSIPPLAAPGPALFHTERAAIRRLRLWLLPLLVAAAGVIGALLMQRAKPTETRAAREKSARIVAVAPLLPKLIRASIVGRGSVQPEREVMLVPEVSGKVIYVAKQLIAGGQVKKDQVLLRIDPRSYQQQVAQEQGALENAALQVDVEKNHRELAQYESELLGQVGQRSRVATREGHVQAAEAGVMARQSAVASAQLNLQRTVIRAPFDASVVEDNVAVGQVVHSQTQVAHLVATAVLRVEVSLPLEDITMFEFPSESSPGALARVRQALPRGQQVEREGRVARLVQQLDSSTRRARVLVTVEDPFDPSRGLPLLPGAHVEVTIQGKQLQNLVAIERAAVYDGNTIWIVDEASKLRRRSITTLWSDRTHVYARPDFGAKERVVTTLLATPMEGLPVRTLQTPAPELEHQAKASKENSGG